MIEIIVEQSHVPVVVDAGIGRPSQACEAMEMGAAAIMANTAIATAGDIPAMAEAFKKAIEAGRAAYLAGLGRVRETASASSPLTEEGYAGRCPDISNKKICASLHGTQIFFLV